MILSRWPCFLAVALLLACGARLSAQTATDNPHVGYVFPAGGCRGTTFEVVVGGQYLKEVDRAYISGGGVQTRIVRWYRPLTDGEFNALQMKIRLKEDEMEKAASGKTATDKAGSDKMMMEKAAARMMIEKAAGKTMRELAIQAAGLTEKELKEMAIYEKRRDDPKRQPNPQIAEELTVQIQLAEDATFGDRELRLLNRTGMSNPLWFYVGQWPEIREKEPNDITPEPSVHVQLPMVINGQIMPGDVDRFQFEAKKGTKLAAQCAARELIPYLADAVPGWFQAVLHLYDDQGNEVAFADSLGFRHDPVLYYEVPKDGRYVIEVHDSIYRGREDFVYRISIGEIPYITSLFPLGGRAGTPCNVEVHGWNLPVQSLRLEPSPYRGHMLRPVVVEQNNIYSNRVGFLVDTVKEVDKREPNHSIETAQEVSTPVVINGRIDHPGDVDYYKFDAAGMFVAEVYARRLYSPLDSVLRLIDGRGRVVAHNDDYEDKSWPLITHHADSRLLTSTKGAHYLAISDAQGRGGPDFAYRLYIRPPRPDFDLRVTPSSVTAQPGTWVPIVVHAIRKDGYSEAIALELDGAPAGFGLSGAWVPAGEDKVRLTLMVPPQAVTEPVRLQMVGHAMGRTRQVSHPALPADSWTQAFAYQHVVPTKDWTIFVTGKPAGKLPCRFVDPGVQLRAGKSGQARLLFDEGRNPRDFKLELSEPPPGITLEDPVPVGLTPGLVVPIKCDAEKVKAGLKGNLLFILSQESKYLGKEDKKFTTSRWVIGMLPAIPFEVLAGR